MNTTRLYDVHPLKIGIFGRTHAGKSQFLYQLLTANSDWVLNKNPAASQFVTNFRQRHDSGESTATESAIDGIQLDLQCPGLDIAIEISFSDLKGEILEADLRSLHDARSDDDNLVQKQIDGQQCNAFLFFFDPISQDQPVRIDQHHEESLEQVRQLLTHVVPAKQNDCLPIIFVLTKKDLWEGAGAASPDTRIEQWKDQAVQELKSQYGRTLGNTFPDNLADPKYVVSEVNSIHPEGEDVFRTIRRLHDLEQQVTKGKQELREKFSKVLYSLIGVSITVVGALCFSIWGREPAETGGIPFRGNSPQGINAMTPEEVASGLEETRKRLEAYLDPAITVSADDAKLLGEDLQWITMKLRLTTRGPESPSSPFDQAPLKEMQDKLAKWLLSRSKLVAKHPIKESRVRLGYMLDKIQPGDTVLDELSLASENYWIAFREEMVLELGTKFRLHRLAKDTSRVTLRDIAAYVSTGLKEVSGSTVLKAKGGLQLQDDLQLAELMLKQFIATGTYSFDVRLAKATFESQFGVDAAKKRRLCLRHGEIEDVAFPLQYSQGTNGGHHARSSCLKTYPVDRMLLDHDGVFYLQIYSGNDWFTIDKRPGWSRLTAEAENEQIVMPGIPLLRMDLDSSAGKTKFEDTLTRLVKMGTGYSFQLKISNLPKFPELLVEAVVRSYSPSVKTP